MAETKPLKSRLLPPNYPMRGPLFRVFTQDLPRTILEALILTRKKIQDKIWALPDTDQRREIPANGQGLFVVVQASGSLVVAMRYQGKDGRHRKVTLGTVDLTVKADPSVKPAIGGHLSHRRPHSAFGPTSEQHRQRHRHLRPGAMTRR